MRKFSFVCSLNAALLILVSCDKPSASAPSPPEGSASATPVSSDVCALLTAQEIEALQNSPIVDTKSSNQLDQDFNVSQCYYTAKETSRSVSLALTMKNPDHEGGRTVMDLWKGIFDRFEEAEDRPASSTAESHGEEEEERRVPPTRITGLGDEAYWLGNRFGGALYVLHKNAMLRLSLGGPDTTERKIENSKVLLEKILARR